MTKTSFPIIPLESQNATSWMSWVNGLMIFLAIFFISASLSFHAIVRYWESSHKNGFTIEIPPHESAQAEASFVATQQKIFEALRQNPAIRNFQVVSKTTIHSTTDFLRNDHVSTHPMPIVVDVEVHPTMVIDLDKLRSELSQLSPGIEILKAREWQAGLMNIASVVFTIGSFLTFLVCCITLAIVMFTTFTGLAIHQKIVNILIQLGATRTYVAQQFQSHALQNTMVSSLIGVGLFLVSGLIVFLLALQYEAMSALQNLPLLAIFLAILGLPLGLMMLSVMMSHLTVYIAIKKYGVC